MTLPVEMTVHLPMLMLVGVTSLPDCDGAERVGWRSPRSCTSAMMTVRPPKVILAVPVIAERRDTLFPESCTHVRLEMEETIRGQSSNAEIIEQWWSLKDTPRAWYGAAHRFDILAFRRDLARRRPRHSQ